MKHRDYSSRLLGFARDMRAKPTDAERKLEGIKFRRQHPLAGYILDFYCEEHRIAVELDGEQHATEEGMAYDRRRERELNRHGIRVLRFSDYDALKDTEAVAMTILREIRNPHPNPLPGGEGA